VLQYELKKRYNLCTYCLHRQLAQAPKRTSELYNKKTKPLKTVKSDLCYICKGIMSELDSTVKMISGAIEAEEYEFDSFILGASLPSAIFEREDSIRARFKVRGRENIKKQFIDELRKRLVKITDKRVQYISPDIAIHVVVANQDTNVTNNSNAYNNTFWQTVSLKAYPIFLSGRYVKTTRGLPQKKDTCQICLGRGCPLCDYTRMSPFDSIEAIISRRVIEITKGDATKFSWLGGEDKDSLVLGKGRPFVVRVSNPKVRGLKRDLIIEANGLSAVIKQQSSKHSFQLPSHFTTKTKITILAQGELSYKKLATLANVLENSEVSFRTKSKILKKKIYSVQAEQIDERRFILTVNADGGLFIKQFVGGQEYSEPNISKIIGIKCECEVFDVLEINAHS
jgi:tRNA pseudouridine synthase 10